MIQPRYNTTTIDHGWRPWRSLAARAHAIRGTEPALTRLRQNDFIYRQAVELIAKVNHPETTLHLVAELASFLYRHHAGRFADGRLENAALRAGAQLPKLPLSGFKAWESVRARVGSSGRRRHVLHVATVAFPIGGHTRMIRHWAECDDTSIHSLILTDQAGHDVPRWIEAAIRNSGGDVAVLSAERMGSMVSRAAVTRELARSADLVVVHHTPFDPIPTAAFAVPDLPPVVILNHADHVFWLGSGVADAVINCRQIGADVTARRRAVSNNLLLPVPLTEPAPALTREGARRALGLCPSQVMLLSVGRVEKFAPSPSHNFLRTAAAILDEVPGASLYVVGLGEAEAKRFAHYLPHGRIHLCGPLENPGLYQRAADVYLESFPFGSQTAVLEAGLLGVPVVPAPSPQCPLLVANDEALDGLLVSPADEADYVQRAVGLARDPDACARLGAALQQRVYDVHVGAAWRRRVLGVYDSVCELTHTPGPIPDTVPETEGVDLGLVEWKLDVPHSSSAWEQTAADRIERSLFDTAHHARACFDYRGARSVLCESWKLFGMRRKVAKEMTKAVIGCATRALLPFRGAVGQ